MQGSSNTGIQQTVCQMLILYSPGPVISSYALLSRKFPLDWDRCVQAFSYIRVKLQCWKSRKFAVICAKTSYPTRP